MEMMYFARKAGHSDGQPSLFQDIPADMFVPSVLKSLHHLCISLYFCFGSWLFSFLMNSSQIDKDKYKGRPWPFSLRFFKVQKIMDITIVELAFIVY